MTRLGKLVDAITQSCRRLRLRWLQGVTTPAQCRIGRNVAFSGNIRIGSGAAIGDGVILRGNIEIGPDCSIGRHVEMHGNIVLKSQCVVGSFSILSTAPEAHILVGTDTYINSYNVLGASKSIEIGNHCIFAAFAYITDATHGIDDLAIATKHAETTVSPVHIGDNVWLGSGVMITMGSTIGRDAVVGAQSLVRGELPDRSISFGTPARVHRIRE